MRILIVGFVLLTNTCLAQIQVSEDENVIEVHNEAQLVLSYQKSLYPAPEGQDDHFARSAFIHPLKSPSGFTLTRIQPDDHYHHYGIWNPYSTVLIEEDTINFWELFREQGTIRFAETLAVGKNSFRVRQDHVVLKEGSEKVVLHEDLTVTVRTENGRYIIDHESVYTCAGSIPFQILKYRYQGFGYRAVGAWDEDNIRMLSSTGNTLDNANFSRGHWILVEGPTEVGLAGIQFMGDPSNFDSPQLFRVWPKGSNGGKENVFINFNPAQDKDWVMKPGQSYTQNYRMIVYDGEMSKTAAEQNWEEYAK